MQLVPNTLGSFTQRFPVQSRLAVTKSGNSWKGLRTLTVSPVVQETDQRVYGGRLACRVLHHIDNLAAQGNWQAVMRFQGRP